MKFQKSIFCAGLILIQSWLGPAMANGGMTGSGGEYIVDEGNPWFIGDKPIGYCIFNGYEQGSFSVPDVTVKEWVNQALSEWVHTLELFPSSPLSLNGKTLDITKTFAQAKSGNEANILDDECELSFVFGIPNAHPKLYEGLSQSWYAKETVAVAQRTSYDETNGRARGVVYFTPDAGSRRFLERYGYNGPKFKSEFWQSEFVFKNVMIHELGHVFGLSHSAGYLMGSKVPAKLVAKGPKTRPESSYFPPSAFYFSGKFINGDMSCFKVRDFSKKSVADLWQINPQDVDELCILKTGMNYSIEVLDQMGHVLHQAELPAKGDTNWSIVPIGGGYFEKDGIGKKLIRHQFIRIPTDLRHFTTVESKQGVIPALVEFSDFTLLTLKIFWQGQFVDIRAYHPEGEG